MSGRRGAPDGGAGRSAYDRALAMLARREYSQRELRTRLEQAGCDAAESEAAIRALQGQHYQDDGRFGDMIVRARVAQGYGPLRIRAELRSHGLADADIEALVSGEGIDWQASARAQLAKKFGNRPAADRAARDKRAAFLVRRGFSSETARIVTRSAVGDPSD